jgi:hypothetical protein
VGWKHGFNFFQDFKQPLAWQIHCQRRLAKIVPIHWIKIFGCVEMKLRDLEFPDDFICRFEAPWIDGFDDGFVKQEVAWNRKERCITMLLCEIAETPCHSQAVERAVKIVSKAALRPVKREKTMDWLQSNWTVARRCHPLARRKIWF